MTQNELSQNNYTKLIKKIKRRKTAVTVCTIIAVLLILVFATPVEIYILDEPFLIRTGLPLGVVAALILACLLIELIAYAIALSPMTNSMIQECDPRKHLILYQALMPRKHFVAAGSLDHLFLGNYEESLRFASEMIGTKKQGYMLSGLFCFASSCFFLERFDELKSRTAEFESILQGLPQSRKKQTYQKMHDVLRLLCALADDDKLQIAAILPGIQCWDQTKPTQGFLHYIKGVAAYQTDDTTEAIYHFKAVMDLCPNCVFSELSRERLFQMTLPW